jgi:hypothetical protein
LAHFKIWGQLISFAGLILSVLLFVSYGYKNVGGISILLWILSPYLVYGIFILFYRNITGIFFAGLLMVVVNMVALFVVFIGKSEGYKLLFFPIFLYAILIFGLFINMLLAKIKKTY